MKHAYLIHIGVLFLMLGCSELESLQQSVDMKSDRDVYPVDPSVQVSEAEAVPTQTFRPAPTISNATAYARYAVGLNTPELLHTEDTQEIALQMAEDAQGATRYALIASIANVGASEAVYASYFSHIKKEARRLNSDALPRLGRQILDGHAKLSTCVDSGQSARECCLGLLWFEGFRDEQGAGGGYMHRTESEIERRLSEGVQGDDIHPFRQSGVRAWLSYCGGVITDAPDTLTAFKQRYGDYHDGAEWTREFHPISPAKQAGRRIFRRQLPDGTRVSIAESTRDDCTVLETETIVKSPGQSALFWVFAEHAQRVNYAFFPTRRAHEDTVKFAPNTCMGCHYTLDTRQFNVVTPSFDALNLTLFESNNGPVWRDHAHCAEPGDTLVLHAVSAKRH